MKKKLLSFSAIGKDQTGIVSSISKVLFELGCNIENSTMTLLSGQFAMILLIAYPKTSNIIKIKTKLKSVLNKMGLYSSLNEINDNSKHIKTYGDYVISVYGADKPGIVYNISKYLSDNRVNITDVQTTVVGAKEKVYIMLLEIQLPKNFKIENLKSAMNDLSKKLTVDISINQADTLEI
jgi:glycine cleavage system transcriptional repressor